SAFKARGWKNSKVLTYENLEKLFAALNAGRCNAMSTDKSALAAWAGNSPKPADYLILADTLDGVVTLSFSGRKGQGLVDIQAKQAAIFHASKASRRW
ncbi:hypothetical protein, partial [Escherichia coli]